MEDLIVFDCNHKDSAGLLLEGQTKTFGKELNFRGYFSEPNSFVRTVWFNTSLFNKSNLCSLIMSRASMCLCIIYMLDLMTASETKPPA